MQGQLKYSLDTPSGPAERVWYSLAKPLLESEGLAPQTSSDTGWGHKEMPAGFIMMKIT